MREVLCQNTFLGETPKVLGMLVDIKGEHVQDLVWLFRWTWITTFFRRTFQLNEDEAEVVCCLF